MPRRVDRRAGKRERRVDSALGALDFALLELLEARVLVEAGHAGAAAVVLGRFERAVGVARGALGAAAAVLPSSGFVSVSALAAAAGCSSWVAQKAAAGGELGELERDGQGRFLIPVDVASAWVAERRRKSSA